jgi:hypothetical protein
MSKCEKDKRNGCSEATRTRRAKVFLTLAAKCLLAPAPERITMRTVRGKLLLGCSVFSPEKSEEHVR